MKIIALREQWLRSLYVLAILGYAGGVSAASELKCIQGGDESYEMFTYLIVDRSDKVELTAPLDQIFSTIKDNVARDASGKRLMIGVITDKVAQTRIAMDRVWPKESVWENRIKLLKERKDFGRCIEDTKKSLMQQTESHKGSAVIETLAFIAKIFQSDTARHKRLIIFSDMVQNSEVLSFYGNSGAATVDALIDRIRKEHLLPSFKGVEIFVSGAGGSISDKRARKVEEFWARYFEASGASLRFYGPLLPGL